MERCDFYIAKCNKKLHYVLESPKALSTRFSPFLYSFLVTVTRGARRVYPDSKKRQGGWKGDNLKDIVMDNQQEPPYYPTHFSLA